MLMMAEISEEKAQANNGLTPLMTATWWITRGRYGLDFYICNTDCIIALIVRLVYGNCSI